MLLRAAVAGAASGSAQDGGAMAAGARGRRRSPQGRVLRAVATMTVAAGAALAGAACGPSQPETISRDAFVNAYAALRQAELTSPEAVIGDAARDSVLAEMGVSEDDMTLFAEVHGADVALMESVWSEVQDRMTELAGTP